MGQVPALVIDGHTLADSVSLLFEITYNIIVLTFNIMVPCKQRFQFSLALLFSVNEVVFIACKSRTWKATGTTS